MKNDEFERLLDLYLKGRLSARQKAELEQQLDDFHQPESIQHEFNEHHADDLLKRIKTKISLRTTSAGAVNLRETSADAVNHTQPRSRSWMPMAAAVIVASVAASLAIFWNLEVTQVASKKILDDGTHRVAQRQLYIKLCRLYHHRPAGDAQRGSIIRSRKECTTSIYHSLRPICCPRVRYQLQYQNKR